MLEDFKIYMQEQLVRKANQKEAIEVHLYRHILRCIYTTGNGGREEEKNS